jgi:hypothetical protein
MQKPNPGELFKVDLNLGLEKFNIIEIVKVEGNVAYYKPLGYPIKTVARWNFKEWPECLEYKLTPLELELI